MGALLLLHVEWALSHAALSGPASGPLHPVPLHTHAFLGENTEGMGCLGDMVTKLGSVCSGQSWVSPVMRREGSGQEMCFSAALSTPTLS